jgi:hypothetical protein
MKKVEYYIVLKKGRSDPGRWVKKCSNEDEAKRESCGLHAERTQEQRDQGWEYSIQPIPWSSNTGLRGASLATRKSRLR